MIRRTDGRQLFIDFTRFAPNINCWQYNTNNNNWHEIRRPQSNILHGKCPVCIQYSLLVYYYLFLSKKRVNTIRRQINGPRPSYATPPLPPSPMVLLARGAEVFKNVSEHQLPRPVSFPFRPHSHGIINTTWNRGIGKYIRNVFSSPGWAGFGHNHRYPPFPGHGELFQKVLLCFFLRIGANSDNNITNLLFDVLETKTKTTRL